MIMLRDYKLFRIVYTADIPVVESVDGTGEVRRTGEFVNEERTWTCVARYKWLAEEFFKERQRFCFAKDYKVLRVDEERIDCINLTYTE